MRYCNGPSQQSYHPKKKKKIVHCDDSFTTSHPNGMTQFPFNMVYRNIVGDMNEVCFSSSYEDFESDNIDELHFDDNNVDNPSGSVNDQILPNNIAVPSNIHHPSIQPTIEASKPFNLDVGMPSCLEFQVQLARICSGYGSRLGYRSPFVQCFAKSGKSSLRV